MVFALTYLRAITRDRVGGAKNPGDSVPCDSRLLEPCNGNVLSQSTTLHVPAETVPFYTYVVHQ